MAHTVHMNVNTSVPSYNMYFLGRGIMLYMQKYNTKVKFVTDVESWKNMSIGRIYAKSTRDIKNFQLVVSPRIHSFAINTV